MEFQVFGFQENKRMKFSLSEKETHHLKNDKLLNRHFPARYK
jgi:hypothetical protein